MSTRTKLWIIAVCSAFVLSGIITFKAEGMEYIEPTCGSAMEVMRIAKVDGRVLVERLEAPNTNVPERVVITAQLKALRELFYAAEGWIKSNCKEV